MRSQTSIVYGRLAYQGFAKAIGARLGLKVQVIDGASACIDANGVIRLPGMSNYQTPGEFAVTCGTVVHELAHQFYESHKQIDPNRSRLEHDCLNAVLDVADETWVAEYFRRDGNGRPGELLDATNTDAFHRNTGAFRDWTNANTHAWKVLCIGILAVRGVRRMNRWKRWTAQQAAALGVDAKACWSLLGKARRARQQNPNPTPRRFAKLIRLAAELAKLLAPFAPPAGAPVPTPDLEVAIAKGSPTQPDGTVEGTLQDAEGFIHGPAQGGNGEAAEGGGEEFDGESYTLLAPAVERVAERIATDGDGLLRDDGLSSGPSLGQAYRIVTDGQCLSRWNTAENADGVSVSVLLDCSDSMDRQLTQCAGIARAFAAGMRAAGDVQALVFGGNVEESDDFGKVRTMGGTATHLAIRKATEWLSGRPGQRWIVVVTDGQPNDRRATAEACEAAAQAGIRILAVGLGFHGKTIRMNRATCVGAEDATHLAIELDAAARMIEVGV